MKKLLFITGVALLGLSPVIAQQGVVKDGPQRSRAEAKRLTPKVSAAQRADARVQRLDKSLNLSPEQKASIRSVYLQDAESRAEQRMETRQKVEAVLTPEQKARFAEQMNNRTEIMKVRKSDRGELKKAPGVQAAPETSAQ